MRALLYTLRQAREIGRRIDTPPTPSIPGASGEFMTRDEARWRSEREAAQGALRVQLLASGVLACALLVAAVLASVAAGRATASEAAAVASQVRGLPAPEVAALVEDAVNAAAGAWIWGVWSVLVLASSEFGAISFGFAPPIGAPFEGWSKRTRYRMRVRWQRLRLRLVTHYQRLRR